MGWTSYSIFDPSLCIPRLLSPLYERVIVSTCSANVILLVVGIPSCYPPEGGLSLTHGETVSGQPQTCRRH